MKGEQGQSKMKCERDCRCRSFAPRRRTPSLDRIVFQLIAKVMDNVLAIEALGEAWISRRVEIEVNSASLSTSIGVLLVGDG